MTRARWARWTRAENSFMAKHADKPVEWVTAQLPGRALGAVVRHFYDLGLTRLRQHRVWLHAEPLSEAERAEKAASVVAYEADVAAGRPIEWRQRNRWDTPKPLTVPEVRLLCEETL